MLSGLDHAIVATLAVALAEGHLLMEDVPGVGKTTLARALAKAVDCTVGRIQFTPDLLPSDVTGVSIYRSDDHEFEFRPGPVFANIVIADEINRASPKTQSALLESMQERAVTADGTTRPLPSPFMVVATQNPIEMEGTYPLPEAQRDRFMAQVAVGLSHVDATRWRCSTPTTARTRSTPSAPSRTSRRSPGLIGIVRRVFAAPAIKQYVVDLVGATRSDGGLRLGASPRASLHLLAVAKARAAMSGAQPRPSGRRQGSRPDRAGAPDDAEHRGPPRGTLGASDPRRDRRRAPRCRPRPATPRRVDPRPSAGAVDGA